MKTFNKQRKAFRCLWVAMGCSLQLAAFAGGVGSIAGTGGASEITQIMNNAQLVKVSVDQALTATTTVQKYMTQIQQYKLQLLNMVGVDASALAANIKDATDAYNNLAGYKQSLEGLTGSMSSQVKMFDQRFLEAKLLNLSFPDYVTRVGQEAQSGNERAKARIQNEKNILDQVNKDYEFAREKAQQIPQAVGEQQSLQLLNAQMNRLVTQNAQIITLLVQAQGSEKAVKDAEEANNRLRAAEQAKRMDDAARAIQQRQDATFRK